jgi:YlzJ-like protein
MTFYTIMPTDQIYPHEPQALTNYIEIIYNGVPVVIEHDGGKTFRIDRILSTNPADFLHLDIQPGAVIPILALMNN